MAASKRTADKQHRWLSQVEVTGVVFSEPVLAEAAPGGFRLLEKKELAKFYKAREIWNLPKGMVEDDGQAQWIQFVLEEVLDLKRANDWKIGAAIPPAWATSLPAQQETLRPTRVLVDKKAGGEPVLLLLEVPRDQSLDRPWLQKTGRWKASPTTKLERLLRETGVELGLVTNGEAWRLLVASPSETASWITWTAQTWRDSPITLAAFRDLLGETRFFAGDRDKVALELIRQSRRRQLDVADQLGAQVREALSLLVRELDRVDESLGGRYLGGYSESEIFEAAVAFVMRLLFSLYAEENGLLPHGTVAYDNAYGVLHLLTELESQHRLDPERLHHSFSAYARLLAAARLIHAGSVDPDIHVAAHGGQLFDPGDYPLLEGRAKDELWPSGTPEPPRVRDSVIRELVRSLKYARADGARQLVSYRELAVEQIGHMYEGLLDRRVARAKEGETLLLLEGSAKVPEPEPLPASELEGLGQDALLKLLAKHTGRTKPTLKKVFEKPEDQARPRDPGASDLRLLAAAHPALRFIERHGVVRPGGLFVTAGEDRRSQGAHYTPPTLTEPIVRRTLEHQVYENVPDKPGLLVKPRKVRSPEALLDLKICDPAMGSGAFLVQAVRYLSERLVDAWEDRREEHPGSILRMPFAVPSEGAEGEAILPETREERLSWAKRSVAERCIYGVDRNRHAVEMSKLSLWIETLATDRPFTFLDHSLRCGDSLVGLTPDQIKSFTWRRTDATPGPLFAHVDQRADEARQFRDRIHTISDHDYESKRNALAKADEALEQGRVAGDLVIAAYFGAENDREREDLRLIYRNKLDASRAGRGGAEELQRTAKDPRDGVAGFATFHWEIEFPEVFRRENPGFDVMVGNPPFLGGSKITRVFGSAYRAFICHQLADNRKGKADLVAYFVLREFAELRNGGTLGMIVTTSLSEGDSRSVCLGPITNMKAVPGKIVRAIRSMTWPGEATVTVSLIWIHRGKWSAPVLLGDSQVPGIGTDLRVESRRLPDPERLSSNKNQTWRGTEIKGPGFVLLDSEAEELISRDTANADVLAKYLTGSDINRSPTFESERWVIDFGELPREQAEKYPDCFSIVTARVKPYRDTLTKQIHESDYWKFWDKRLANYARISGRDRVLVLPLVTKYNSFAFVAADQIFSNKVQIFTYAGFDMFAVLQSSLHYEWCLRFSPRNLSLLAYSPRACFETFPFPLDTIRCDSLLEVTDEDATDLWALGQTYHRDRSAILQELEIGLTELYNRYNDGSIGAEAIGAFRAMHRGLDRAVLDSYGWTDLPTDYDFRETAESHSDSSGDAKRPSRYRWSDEVIDEVLARLLELNRARAAKEK